MSLSLLGITIKRANLQISIDRDIRVFCVVGQNENSAGLLCPLAYFHSILPIEIPRPGPIRPPIGMLQVEYMYRQITQKTSRPFSV